MPPPPPALPRRKAAATPTLLQRGEPPRGGPLGGVPVAELPLRAERAVLGRQDADLVLDSPVVSRRHAIVRRRADGSHELEDLGSVNGTFVGGRRVQRHVLHAGDVARIGPFELAYRGASLSVRDLRGALRVDGRGLGRRVRGDRWILRDVSLSILPREFVALVGGSGAGKSTLMRLLSAQHEPTTGSVQYNGEDAGEHFDRFRALVGYVPQDDILHKELPVRRALRYAAALRLPPDTSRAERAARIERALAEVDMVEHADKRISNLSGGQRKRVSIASELLADPALFFLDEPTSGLDPGLEKKMMKTLRRLANGGRTVVLVTHATANLDQCDHVAFLADGRLVYFGPPGEALGFFGVQTGDMADVYERLEGVADPARPERVAVAASLGVPKEELAKRVKAGAPLSLAALWESAFRRSALHRRWIAGRLATVPEPRERRGFGRRMPRASSLRQLAVLGLRYADLSLADGKNLGVLLLQAPVIAYLTTLVAKKDALLGSRPTSYDAKVLLFLLATVSAWFGIINAAREIAKEAPIFARERLAGLRIAPYLASKLLVLAALTAVQSVILLAVIATKVDLPKAGVAWAANAELFATTFLSGLAALSLGLCISAAARTTDRAISAIPLALVPQILFSGVLFPLGAERSVMRVLSWFTIGRWATDAYGVTAHLSRFADLRKTTDYAFTKAALMDKWGALGAHAGVYLLVAAILLSRRDRD